MISNKKRMFLIVQNILEPRQIIKGFKISFENLYWLFLSALFAKGEYTPSTNIMAALGGTSQGYETRQPGRISYIGWVFHWAMETLKTSQVHFFRYPLNENQTWKKFMQKLKENKF